MFIDYQLTLSDKQALTATATSTNQIDTIMAGWGHNEEVYARFMVTTAFGVTTTSSVTMAIQIAQDTAFASALTVVTIGKIVSQLTVNSIPAVVKLPVAMMTGFGSTTPYRYIRAVYTLSAGASSGSISCHLLKDTPVTVDKAL